MTRGVACVVLVAAVSTFPAACATWSDPFTPAPDERTTGTTAGEQHTPPDLRDRLVQYPLPVSPPVEPVAAVFAGPPAALVESTGGPLVQRSIWNRLRGGFALEAVDNKRVQRELDWYVAHPAYINRVAQRARPFMYFILERTEQRDVPSEIALLPVVESAFNVFAYSPGRAAGIWQFIPATGRRYGLKQNWWYDGRRDVQAATDAALDYLSALAQEFSGDWLLALAAYNSGSGTVASAIRRNTRQGKPTDFWHLDLPRETRSYVPKLLALREMLADPARYGITLPPVADVQVIAAADTRGQLDLAVASELAGLSMAELYELNPAFNRWATDPDGPHRLLMPVENVAAFEQSLQALPLESRVTWSRHRIRSGETLSEIATAHRTTVTQLKAVNAIRGTTIRAGSYLLIPAPARNAGAYSLSATQRRKRLQNQPRSGQKVVHVVRRGDTLWDLSQQYQVSPARVAKWNGMSPRDLIQPGQELVLWIVPGHAGTTAGVGLSSQQAVQRIRYTVRSGDSLSRIASRFNVTVQDLKRWNKSQLRGKYLQPGQRLNLYIDLRQQSG